MPITLQTAHHSAQKWTGPRALSPSALFEQSCPREFRRSKNLLRSSFTQDQLHNHHLSASEHGLIYAVYHAYSHHHHLTLRPEDVWFSILTQLGFFINANAEQVRSYFVAHDGQKQLEIISGGNIDTADFASMALQMTELIEKNVVDPELRAWIMPAFSTTTASDRVVAAILMMGAMQKYFSYQVMLMCGIPTVTLLGERADWAQMLHKIDKVARLGEQPARFVELLRPVLRRFVASFDEPESLEVLDFWSRCAHMSGGSGPQYFSGWITAFCFWSADGRCLYDGGLDREGSFGQSPLGCELDGVRYHRVETDDVPSGYVSVPVTVDDNGKIHETKMLAGMVGIQATPREHQQGNSHVPTEQAVVDSIRPVSGWWMYETEGPEEAEARETESQNIDAELSSLGDVKSPGGNWDRYIQLWRRKNELEAF